MKKTLLMTGLLSLCSQTLMSVSAQTAVEPDDTTVIESTTLEEDGTEGVDEELTTTSTDEETSAPGAIEQKLTFELPNSVILEEFLSELKELPFADKLDIANAVQTPSSDDEGATFTLEITSKSVLTQENEEAVDALYKAHTSTERTTLDAPFNFDTEDEAKAYTKDVLEKGLHDGKNLVHMEADVEEGAEGGFSVKFMLNTAQIKDGLTPKFGKDKIIHLYDSTDAVVGEDPTEMNEVYVEPTPELEDVQPESKPEVEPESKPEVKPETQPEQQVEVRDEVTNTVEELIPFEVERVEDKTIRKGQEKVTREGVNGIKVVKSVQETLNGKPVGEPVVTEEVKTEPVNQIISVGIGEVENVEETKEEVIPFETEERKTDKLKSGERKTVQQGVNGVKVIKTITPKFNGEVVGQATTTEEIKQAPVNEIIGVGVGTEEDHVDTKEEKIPFETEERKTDTRKAGERVVIRTGVEGLKQIKTTQKMVNGQPSGQPVVEETVLRQPVNEIVEVGTNTNTNLTAPSASPSNTTSPTGQPVNNTATPGTVTTTTEYVTIARKHTVQAGETLNSIAQKYNTTPEKIKAWNTLTSDYVYQGQVLTVSDAMSVPVEEYIAVQGDTAQSIADRFGMSVGDLQRLNNNDPLSHIVQGQVVRVIDLKKGFGENAANTTSLTPDFKQGQQQTAPLADKSYETPRVQEQVVPIPETGESNTLGIVGIVTLVVGAVLAFFGLKKKNDGDGTVQE